MNFESNGTAIDYAMIFFFSGGAFILFLYFYLTGKHDFDEAPKYQMMEDEREPR